MTFKPDPRAKGSGHGLIGLAKMAFGLRAFGLGPGPPPPLRFPTDSAPVEVPLVRSLLWHHLHF